MASLEPENEHQQQQQQVSVVAADSAQRSFSIHVREEIGRELSKSLLEQALIKVHELSFQPPQTTLSGNFDEPLLLGRLTNKNNISNSNSNKSCAPIKKKMSCTQAVELENANQRVGSGEEEAEEEEDKDELELSSLATTKVATTNEDSCAEIEEEEIVVQSFASLAGIEDVNEEELEGEEVSGSGCAEKTNNQKQPLLSKITKTPASDDVNVEEANLSSDVSLPSSCPMMLADKQPVGEEAAVTGAKETQEYSPESIDNNNQQVKKEKQEYCHQANAEKLPQQEESQQTSTGDHAETPVERRQKEGPESVGESEDILPDDYCQAVASVAVEQRRLKTQISLIAASPPPTPPTPLSPAPSSINLSKSFNSTAAEIQQSVAANVETGSEGTSYEEEEEDDENDDEEDEKEEVEEEEDFCAEAASTSTLRKLKMSTYEDVLVCERSRDSMEAARRLFDELARNGPPSKASNGLTCSTFSRNGSIGSSTEEADAGISLSGSEFQQQEQPYDMKIVRRSGSSVSNSNYFRRTLVCSVSPISQLSGSGCSDALSYIETHSPYPIDGDEIQQCRSAFRENKRLIEEQQVRAATDKSGGELMSCASSISGQIESNSSSGRWIRFNREFLEQASQSKCSRCNQRLYPVDKIELDFTRTKLNIHRNCFKCQVCSTLLR